MPIIPIERKGKVIEPQIDETVWISKYALVIGDVTIGPETVVYQNAVIRGDFASVKIGAKNVIQDAAIINTAAGSKAVIGDNNLIGFNALIHGAIVGNNAVIGIGATLMTGVKIADNVLIGAGAFLKMGFKTEEGKFYIGTPAEEKGENKQGDMWELGRKSWRENALNVLKNTET